MLFERNHAKKDKVAVCIVVGKTVDGVRLNEDSVFFPDSAGFPLIEDRAFSLEDIHFMFPGVDMPRGRSPGFDDKITHRESWDSVRPVEEPADCCSMCASLGDGYFLGVLDRLDNHESLPVKYANAQ